MLSHCASIVKDHDYDRYLCTLFAPASVREAWFALFAFNHEIASIDESVTEEMIGFMRFAWWREALDEIYAGGPVRRYPVVQALAEVMKAHNLPRELFDTMIDAREANLKHDIAEAREPYFHATSSILLVLCAGAAGVEMSPALDALGIAWAAVGTARVLKATGRKHDELLRVAETRLVEAHDLSGLFMPFLHAAGFYLKRLKAGKPTGAESRVLLILSLYGRRILGRG